MRDHENFWDRNAARYDRFMRKDRAAYDEMYELIRPIVRHKTLLEEVGIQGRGFQIGLHEAFETVSFVALGKGVLAEFIQNLGECTHRARLYTLTKIIISPQ